MRIRWRRKQLNGKKQCSQSAFLYRSPYSTPYSRFSMISWIRMNGIRGWQWMLNSSFFIFLFSRTALVFFISLHLSTYSRSSCWFFFLLSSLINLRFLLALSPLSIFLLSLSISPPLLPPLPHSYFSTFFSQTLPPRRPFPRPMATIPSSSSFDLSSNR